MRIIKFRAWDKQDKKIYPVTALYDDGTCRIQDDVSNLPLHYSKCEIMQFTGLLDKNGKEVYEGDIIKTKTDIFTIQYSEKDFCFIFLVKNCMSFFGLSFLVGLKDFEAIGNIYENPELLEVK